MGTAKDRSSVGSSSIARGRVRRQVLTLCARRDGVDESIETFSVGVPEVRLWGPPQSPCNILGAPLWHRAAFERAGRAHGEVAARGC